MVNVALTRFGLTVHGEIWSCRGGRRGRGREGRRKAGRDWDCLYWLGMRGRDKSYLFSSIALPLPPSLSFSPFPSLHSRPTNCTNRPHPPPNPAPSPAESRLKSHQNRPSRTYSSSSSVAPCLSSRDPLHQQHRRRHPVSAPRPTQISCGIDGPLDEGSSRSG